jgi:hypothetical protein
MIGRPPNLQNCKKQNPDEEIGESKLPALGTMAATMQGGTRFATSLVLIRSLP